MRKFCETIKSDYETFDVAKLRVEIPSVITSMMNSQCPRILPQGFQPSEYDVVCGRGRGFYRKSGNKRFRAIVLTHIEEYRRMKTKIDKTSTVSQVIDHVLSQNDGNVRFVKQIDSKMWEELGHDQIRDKVGHAIREALSSQNKGKNSTNTNKKDTQKKEAHETKSNENLCHLSQYTSSSKDMYEPFPMNHAMNYPEDILSSSFSHGEIGELMGLFDSHDEFV
jgi:methyltransferase-like protein